MSLQQENDSQRFRYFKFQIPQKWVNSDFGKGLRKKSEN